MRSKKTAVALVIIAAACWFWAERSSHRAKASFATISRERTIIERDIRQAEVQAAKEERKLDDLRRTPPAGIPTQAPATRGEKAIAPRPPSSQRELISSDPKLEVLSLKWSRAVVGLEYGPLYRALNLSPEQIAKFENNYVKHDELAMDVAAVAQGKDENGQKTAAALQQQAKAVYEAAQIEVLGNEGFRQADEYIRTLVPRNVFVLGLAGVAAFEGIPLTTQQGDQLWQAALKATGNPANAKGSKLLDGLDWDAFDAQAQQILTPAQFELFKNVDPPSGFGSRTSLRSKAIIRRAQEADAAAAGPAQGGPH